MIYIPLQHLRPGMQLARSVYFDPSTLPLLVAKQELTQQIINKLEVLNIPGLYIENSFGHDIEVEEFIDLKVKKQLTRELHTLHEGYIQSTVLSCELVEIMRNITEALLEHINSRNDLLFNIIDIKSYDNYTYSHSIYVGTLSVLIGSQLGFPKQMLMELAMAGLFHDLGKLEIPLSIINKNDYLTAEEFEEMKSHPYKAAVRLHNLIGISETVIWGIECHHEKYDGTGYPHNLQGEEIPIYGRILALADVYDALTSVRSYRKAWLPHEAIEYMMAYSGTHFDYNILQSFLKVIAPYPAGTVVQLSNGSFAVVLRNSQSNVLRPIIRVLTPPFMEGNEIDLASDNRYLNVTITGTLADAAELPAALLKK